MKRAIKRVCCLLSVLFLLSAAQGNAAADVYFEQGDLNGDLRVTAADASVLLRMLRTPGQMSPLACERADVTQSGTVNKVDARVILHVAAGNIPDLVPFVARISTGLCAETLFDRFSYTGARQSGFDYRDESVCLTVTEMEYKNAVCYLADIYVQDITLLRTAFSGGKYRGRVQYTDAIASSVGAWIAVNGDYYSAQRKGPLVRNGVTYIERITDQMDIAVLTWEGRLLTFKKGTLNTTAFGALHPYQTWVFGPRLLDDDGHAFPSITGNLSGRNPRTVIGYYEPGHYCLAVIDGRQRPYSSGLTFTDLSALMESLGCKAAYNLDGGQTSMMATASGRVNSPYKDGRPVSDIIYIGS